MDDRSIIKEASDLKKAGDINGAILKLYLICKPGTKTTPCDECLRLPLYLQQAGRSDEAWAILNEYLYFEQPKNDVYSIHFIAKLYDKMRMLLQKKGNHKRAIHFGIMHHIYLLRSAYKNIKVHVDNISKFTSSRYDPHDIENIVRINRDAKAREKKHIINLSSKDKIKSVIMPLLKKGKFDSCYEDINNIVMIWVEKLPLCNDKDYSDRIDAVLKSAENNRTT